MVGATNTIFYASEAGFSITEKTVGEAPTILASTQQIIYCYASSHPCCGQIQETIR
jgi:hypothetical protein